MRNHPWWPGMALLAGPWLAACQAPAATELADADASMSRIPDGYDLIEIGVLAGDNYSYPMAVNNRSEVTGMSTTQDSWAVASGFYWSEDEGITDLGGVIGYEWVQTHDINDRGLIVGTLSSDIEPLRGFIWDDGQFEIIEPPPGAYDIGAHGINRDGLIVGATDFTPGAREAFLLSESEFLPLGMAEGGTWSMAVAINRRGDIIGLGNNGAGVEVGLLWEDRGERLIDLSEVLSIPDFLPNAISRGGALAGSSRSLHHAVLVERDGQATDLQSLAGPGGSSEGLGINRSEQVVGTSSTPEGASHAFVWEDGEMVDLNTLIDPGTGVELTEARSINDDGEIAVVGIRAGESRAFLLRPQ